MSRKGGKISLLLGLLTGTLTGLLFAPSKGSQLRKKITKERRAGGLGYKAVGQELSEMADEISKMVRDVSQTEEAKAFWHKTHQTVSELTEGNVDLDKWAKQAEAKADLLKKTIGQYVTERKKVLNGARKKAGRTVKKVKKFSKKIKSEWAEASKKSVKANKKTRRRRTIAKTKKSTS